MYKSIFKRLIDLTFGILLLPFFLIIYIVLFLLIKTEDGGPIFYNAARLGKDGQVFKMYKFRSMKMNAPDIRNDDGSTFNSENDPRLLKIGKIIRKSSIDEIPQILNVIIGNMSFVGPRPDLPEHIEMYTEVEKEKLSVQPGITGYSQAYYRNSIDWTRRKELDVYYAKNISLIFDMKIILKTISSVLFKKNVFQE
jgi:undecaprenyl phosphate N,N'-diacetylbacillosamine 1-phosphate transferase